MKTRKASSLLVLMSFLIYMSVSCLSVSASINAGTTPDLGGSINGGNVGINGKVQGADGKWYDNFEVNIKDNIGAGGVAQFDWNSFNVGSGVAVNWGFNNISQTIINRVLQEGGMSQIYGMLMQSSLINCDSCTSSSKVILFNPSGIMFNNGSSVNLNSFTATTFDILGMKNIKDMSASDIAAYGLTGGANNKYLANNNSNFWKAYSFGSDNSNPTSSIQFVSNDNKVKYDSARGNYYLTNDGNGEIAYIGANGSKITANKFIGMVGNKIDIKNSDLKTHTGITSNYPDGQGTIKSNIRLVTSDGVNFVYDQSGSVAYNNFDAKTGATAKTGSGYGINIDNSNVKSGYIAMVDTVNGDSNINIKNNSTIFSSKLISPVTGVPQTTGDINIQTNGNLTIENSQLQTLNKWDATDSHPLTNVQEGGNIDLGAGKNINITNTKIMTADSNKSAAGSVNSGNINIVSKNGSINIKRDAGYTTGHTKDGGTYGDIDIISAGNMNIIAKNGNIKADTYGRIQAQGAASSEGGGSYKDRNLNMTAKNIELSNGDFAAYNITLAADNAINIANAMLYTGSLSGANNGALSLLGRNTTIDNSNLIYDYLYFYNNNMYNNDILNNVTIKNGSTFFDRIAEANPSTPFMLLTNGNITIDNSSLKSRDFIEETQKLADVVNDQKQILIQSLKGNVDIKNNSNIASSSGTIAIKAVNDLSGSAPGLGGSVKISDSTINAKGLVNIKAKDDITFNNSNVKAQTGDVKINTALGKVAMANSNIEALMENVTITQQSKGSNLDDNYKNSTVKAAKNTTLTVNGSTSDITGSNLSAFIAGDRIKMNADRNIALSDRSQNMTRVDFTAGNNTSVIATAGDASFDDVNFVSGADNTVTASGNATIKNTKFTGSNNALSAATTNISNTNFTAGNTTSVTSTTGNTVLDDVNFDSANNTISSNGNLTANNTNFTAGNTTSTTAKGATNLKNVTLNSSTENKVTSDGDVNVDKAVITKGKTTIDSNNGSVKTINGQTINANGNKLIVNAGKDVDLLLEGVGNRANGIEINSKFDTSTRDKQAAIKGKTVTVIAKDGRLAIAKIKAGKLNMDSSNALYSSTESNIITDKENTSLVPEEYKTMSYIEVADGAVQDLNSDNTNHMVGQWNFDTDVYNSEIGQLPPFYDGTNGHFDEQGTTGSMDFAKHFINFGGDNKFLLVYDRYANCPTVNPVPPTVDPPVVNVNPDQSIAKLPRHEEGVSYLAPIANYITDPMGNVIAAAASLTLDEDDEDDKY